MPKIFIASDHAGFQFKNELMRACPAVEWKDIGPFNDTRTDYPDWADKLIGELDKNSGFGILICSSGQEITIKANHHKSIRAALY
jgi:ribose 5-phosphate isomerase B